MKKFSQVTALFAVGISLLAPGVQGTAFAAGQIQFVGTGTSSPGVPTTGCAHQTVTFSSVAAVAVGDGAGTYSFTFTGNSSICETLNSGQGSGTLSGDITGSISYTRTGTHTTISGSISIGGERASVSAAANPYTIAAGECATVPHSYNPVGSWGWECVWVYA